MQCVIHPGSSKLQQVSKVQAAGVGMVNINFPIQKQAEKFQKSIKKRKMAGKKEMIAEGS